MGELYAVGAFTKTEGFIHLELLFPILDAVPFQIMSENKSSPLRIEKTVFIIHHVIEDVTEDRAFMRFYFYDHWMK